MKTYISFATFLLLLSSAHCMLPWTKKNRAVSQMHLIKDISKELKAKADSLPSQEDISNKIHRIDAAVIDQINKEIVKEHILENKPHICEDPSFERNYSELCPEEWILNSSGECWGEHYDGHCEALKYFQEYSDAEKREFELNCCVLWPKLISKEKKMSKMDSLRGSINAESGNIILPMKL